VERGTVGACPDLNCGSGGSIGCYSTTCIKLAVFCSCSPLYKFVYSLKVVKLFLKHPIYYYSDKIKTDEMGDVCSTCARDEKCVQDFWSENPEGKRHHFEDVHVASRIILN
jgi:hypothetical protein